MAEEAKPLTWQHKANVGAFALNCLVVFGSQANLFQALGMQTNTEISEKYQTIITPAGAAFSIWGIIFMLEAMFTIVQVLPSFRARPVINVVTPWWLAAQGSQVLWSTFFAFEFIGFSQVLICLIFISLAGLLLSVEAMEELPAKDEWLLMTGFQIHLGWVMAATGVGFNVCVVASGEGIPGQLAAAVVSLAGVFAGGAVFATALRRRPSFWVGLVVAWASNFIKSNLEEAKVLRDSSREFYTAWGDDTIAGVREAAAWLSVGGLVLAVVAVGLRVRFAYSAQAQSERAKGEGEVPFADAEMAMGA